MAEGTSARTLKKVSLFNGMGSQELAQVAKLCASRTVGVGELSVKQGETQSAIHIVEKGRMGVETVLPSAPKDKKNIVIDMLADGEIYSWSALMRKPATASVRAIDKTKVLDIEVQELLDLCEKDAHIGYVVMKNLSSLISSRLTRHRLALLSVMGSFGEGW